MPNIFVQSILGLFIVFVEQLFQYKSGWFTSIIFAPQFFSDTIISDTHVPKFGGSWLRIDLMDLFRSFRTILYGNSKHSGFSLLEWLMNMPTTAGFLHKTIEVRLDSFAENGKAALCAVI